MRLLQPHGKDGKKGQLMSYPIRPEQDILYIPTKENPMPELNNQSITIPLSSSLDLEALLELAQRLTEELEHQIFEAGGDCAIEEDDVSVEYK